MKCAIVIRDGARKKTALSTPELPAGNATLPIASGFAVPAGTVNPLAGRPYGLLRESYASAVEKTGVTVPAGMSPHKYVGTICGELSARMPAGQKSMALDQSNATPVQ